MRSCAILGGVLLVLLLAPDAAGQDAHPHDRKIVFFRKPDQATRERIEKAVTNDFLSNLAGERAAAREVCLESALWSVPFLRKLVERRVKNQPIQRWNAILTLASIVDPRAARTLRIAAEHDDNPRVRAFACLALGLHGGPDSVEVLVRLLKGKSHQDVVTTAALALARIQGEEAENALQRLIRVGRTDRSRAVALVGLGMFPSSRTMETARRFLRDSKSPVVRRAVLALVNAAFGAREARRAELEKILERPTTDAEARAFALLALARFEGFRGASMLLSRALVDRDSAVVEAAARALQHRGDSRTRKAVMAKLRQTIHGDAHLAVRLMLALAEIEARSPTEEGLGYLVGRLGSRSSAVRIYAAIALTRVDDAFVDHPALRDRALRVLRCALAGDGGSLGGEERSSYRRAIALIDPENPPSEVPDEWSSMWHEDPILPTIGETLHDVLLEKTNQLVAEELQLHTIIDRTVSRRDPAAGNERKVADENKGLRDLREWLKDHPYFTAAELPDRGYRE